MNLKKIVWKELRERPTAMMTGVLAVFLGVTALVAIRHVTVFSERECASPHRGEDICPVSRRFAGLLNFAVI